MTAGKPPKSMQATTTATNPTSRAWRRVATRSSAQNSAGIHAATRVWGQPVHITMNPEEKNSRPPTSPAERRTPRRARKPAIPTTIVTSSASFTNAGASHSGSTR